MPRLLIHATNIHRGGGAVLLIELLRAIPSGLDAIVAVDARLMVPTSIPSHITIQCIKPTFFGRLKAEFDLVKMANNEDWVLCFGSLPPLFKVKGDVSVFVQNRYLVDNLSMLSKLPVNLRLRLFAEWIWLGLLRNRAKRYFVQTYSMMRLIHKRLGVRAICTPFVPESVICQEFNNTSRPLRFDFLYVASGEPHKNHSALISAWTILASEGCYPSLALTLSLDDAPELMELVEAESASKRIRIHNLGKLSYDRLQNVYHESRALIYTSSFESFGLPLIEARSAGLAVLAPELDYVRDIVDPEETFDPQSPLSISRAVKRHLKRIDAPFEPLKVRGFLDKVIGRSFQ